jgi:hypothetical protein
LPLFLGQIRHFREQPKPACVQRIVRNQPLSEIDNLPPSFGLSWCAEIWAADQRRTCVRCAVIRRHGIFVQEPKVFLLVLVVRFQQFGACTFGQRHKSERIAGVKAKGKLRVGFTESEWQALRQYQPD